jgi:hypothetical protein
MNIGFYVETNAGTPQNTTIYNYLNKAVENGEVRNATVFFNDVGFNPVVPKFGMFDAADLWSFKGDLVCTSVNNLRKSSSIVNNIKTCYLFSTNDPVEKHIFDFVNIAKHYKVLVTNLVDQNTFYRLTGKMPIMIDNWSTDKLSEVFDE